MYKIFFLAAIIVFFDCNNSYALDLLGALDPTCGQKYTNAQYSSNFNDVYENQKTVKDIYEELKADPNNLNINYYLSDLKRNIISYPQLNFLRKQGSKYYSISFGEKINGENITKYSVRISNSSSCSNSDSKLVYEITNLINRLPLSEICKAELKNNIKISIPEPSSHIFDIY